MTYNSVWWYPNYVEYAAGMNLPKTWPHVQEQYRRPHATENLRYYDLPLDRYQDRLYYRLPRLGVPQYRATFRDKPHTLARHYPDVAPGGKPKGFHGRMYYEYGPPQFKYDGPHKDELYWLERCPYLPDICGSQCNVSSSGVRDSLRAMQTSCPSYSSVTTSTCDPLTASRDAHALDLAKRQTQDGVGLL